MQKGDKAQVITIFYHNLLNYQLVKILLNQVYYSVRDYHNEYNATEFTAMCVRQYKKGRHISFYAYRDIY